MPVKVAAGLAAKIRKYPDSIVVQVRDPSDPEAATEALERARTEIASLDGGWESAPGLSPGDHNGPTFVGPVMPVPSGPCLYVDGGSTPRKLLATIPDIVVRHLVETGVDVATIDSPANKGPLYSPGAPLLQYIPRAAVLHLYPPPPTVRRRQLQHAKVPPSYLTAACAWVTEGLNPHDELWAQVMAAEFPLSPPDALAVVERCRRAGLVGLLAGDPTSVFRRVEGSFIGYQGLALGGGGPAASDDELVTTAESLIEVARRLGPELAYAYVSIEATFGALSRSWSLWRQEGGAPPELIQGLCDELVVDGFPFQVLGPGHVERLASGGSPVFGPSTLSPGPRPLAGGRVELVVGNLEDWLPERPAREHIQQQARELLAPCLLTWDETLAYRQAKAAHNEEAADR